MFCSLVLAPRRRLNLQSLGKLLWHDHLWMGCQMTTWECARGAARTRSDRLPPCQCFPRSGVGLWFWVRPGLTLRAGRCVFGYRSLIRCQALHTLNEAWCKGGRGTHTLLKLAGRLQARVPGGQIDFSACGTSKDRLGWWSAGTGSDGPSVNHRPTR